jgi:hypothetical protein
MLSVVAILLLSYGGCALWVEKVNGIPREARLTDCTQPDLHFRLDCPSGSHYQLLLGVPEKKVDLRNPAAHPNKPPPFKGEVIITQAGQLIHRFPIVSTDAESSNWLEDHGLVGGYILTNHEKVRLDDHLKPGQEYDMTVSFTRQPPRNTSLWLRWLTSYR